MKEGGRGHATQGAIQPISRYISRSFIMAVWILWCCSRHLQGGCTVFGMPVGRWQTWMNHLDCGIIGFPCQRRSRSPVIALSVMCKPGWCWDDLVQRHASTPWSWKRQRLAWQGCVWTGQFISMSTCWGCNSYHCIGSWAYLANLVASASCATSNIFWLFTGVCSLIMGGASTP